ncbi:hypothetical protein ACFPIJ_00290 [Dactylosporangium cerinum]|uniref:Uncharacterized protein n=1 Tax=Dactylosporangium cerinum TaxID=1434730 RepID=A0ABV9VNU7_9ACTN
MAVQREWDELRDHLAYLKNSRPVRPWGLDEIRNGFLKIPPLDRQAKMPPGFAQQHIHPYPSKSGWGDAWRAFDRPSGLGRKLPDLHQFVLPWAIVTGTKRDVMRALALYAAAESVGTTTSATSDAEQPPADASVRTAAGATSAVGHSEQLDGAEPELTVAGDRHDEAFAAPGQVALTGRPHIKDVGTFQRELVIATAGAQSHIYRSGTGSLRPPTEYFRELEAAERTALARGVEFIRIQTSPVVDPTWAAMLAQIKRDYGDRYRVLSTPMPWPLDACIVDPDGDAIVVLLFESDAWDGTRFVTAEVVRGDQEFARSLSKHFIALDEPKNELDADGIEKLGQSELVVAYGDHMNKNYNRATTPGAQPAGMVTLHGWTRTFYAPPDCQSPRKCALGMMRSTKSRGEPVLALRIPHEQLKLLDVAEAGRGYRSDTLSITLNGEPKAARIYVPTHIPDDVDAELRNCLVEGRPGWVPPDRQILNDTIRGVQQMLSDGWRPLRQDQRAALNTLLDRLLELRDELS